MSTHKTAFDDVFRRLSDNGNLVSPRGLLVKEVENFSYVLPPYVRFQNYECRKLNLSYLKREMMWYLKGDRYDTSICQHAKTWRDIVNVDGSINSNYGQYVFRPVLNQFDNVVSLLKKDPDSRRASITILNSTHLLSDTKDVPCTYSLNFRIRNGRLNMSVHMRSQDAIYGMGNDAPAFSIIQEMVCASLLDNYPDLRLGDYFHVVDSFHVYERHFKMLEEILAGSSYSEVIVPRISGPAEVRYLLSTGFQLAAMPAGVPEGYAFAAWLKDI